MNPRSNISRAVLGVTIGLAVSAGLALHAAPVFPAPVEADEAGFRTIFDGRTLTGWDADPIYWRVEAGCLIGEVTPATLLKANSFAIWRGGTPADFELKVEYRVTAEGNSGINYRSVELSSPRYALKGYQCDIDGALRWTGQNYEERGRRFLALRGQLTRAGEAPRPSLLATAGDAAALAARVNSGDWNQVHLIAQGNVLIHLINGQLMSVVIDEDPAARALSGLIGVQVHVGPPMKIEYRNFRLKELPPLAPVPRHSPEPRAS